VVADRPFFDHHPNSSESEYWLATFATLQDLGYTLHMVSQPSIALAGDDTCSIVPSRYLVGRTTVCKHISPYTATPGPKQHQS
jgi:hypothetical protein